MDEHKKPLLVLNFWNGESPELISTTFFHPLIEKIHKTNRGRGRSAFRGSGSFEWTKAVQGIAALLLTACSSEERDADLTGGGASLASSLDYAIDKQPEWMVDMFGTEKNGNPLLKRMIIRSNSGRKRPGPVALSLNRQFFNVNFVQFTINAKPVVERTTISALAGEIISKFETPEQLTLVSDNTEPRLSTRSPNRESLLSPYTDYFEADERAGLECIRA